MWTSVNVKPRPGAFTPPLNTTAHPIGSKEIQVQKTSPKYYFPNSLHLPKLNSIFKIGVSPFPIHRVSTHLPHTLNLPDIQILYASVFFFHKGAVINPLHDCRNSFSCHMAGVTNWSCGLDGVTSLPGQTNLENFSVSVGVGIQNETCLPFIVYAFPKVILDFLV